MSDSISEKDITVFLKTLNRLRIMDDVLMNEFVKRDKENGYQALGVILKAFTGLDLKVRTAEVQSILTGAGGRSVWLDIEAEDEQGRIIDLEMQRAVGDVLPKRAVLHMSTIVTNEVRRGDSFAKVPEVWVIFVTETDFAKDGKASHHYQFRDEKGKLLGDPMHIVMVNGEYKKTDTLEGRVIHDLMTTDPQAMLIPEIQKPFADLKETEKGQREMTEALEQLVQGGREDGIRIGSFNTMKVIVQNMLADGFPFDQIVRLTGASADDVQKIMDNIATDSQV